MNRFIVFLLMSLPFCAIADDYLITVDNALRDGDYKTVFSITERFAMRGDADALYGLSLLYRDGKGVSASDSMAKYYLARAVDAGSFDAEFYFAKEKGLKYSFDTMKKLADKDFAPAQLFLAKALIGGIATKRDIEAGRLWLEKASKNKYLPAITLYAQLLSEGKVFPKDLAKAESLSQRLK